MHSHLPFYHGTCERNRRSAKCGGAEPAVSGELLSPTKQLSLSAALAEPAADSSNPGSGFASVSYVENSPSLCFSHDSTMATSPLSRSAANRSPHRSSAASHFSTFRQ